MAHIRQSRPEYKTVKSRAGRKATRSTRPSSTRRASGYAYRNPAGTYKTVKVAHIRQSRWHIYGSQDSHVAHIRQSRQSCGWAGRKATRSTRPSSTRRASGYASRERELFIDNLLVRIPGNHLMPNFPIPGNHLMATHWIMLHWSHWIHIPLDQFNPRVSYLVRNLYWVNLVSDEVEVRCVIMCGRRTWPTLDHKLILSTYHKLILSTYFYQLYQLI